ncbi:MAG: proteasome accessory factor PafA2 [Actinobacteria bacterium]|nr:proteasome accessory factor PafA2 [Actinomycetota bacterium]
MPTPIVCGIETEYGIIVRSPEGRVASLSPMTASSILVSAYEDSGLEVQRTERAVVRWDFDDETPANDARDGVSVATYAPEVETHLVNTVLSNGSRFYVDHAHPELSTPECRTPEEVVRYDRAGEVILRRAMDSAKGSMPPGHEIVVYKNNSDGKGQSYGCHENYLLARSTPFGDVARHAMAHLVSRQVFCGAGKVGHESDGHPAVGDEFQISQRADFFEEPIGLETTLKRPIVNTRDEPHADSARFRRFHVIVGDANMSEVATLLKVGSTMLWLGLLEAPGRPEPIVFRDPVRAIRTISHDPTLQTIVELDDGSQVRALDLQWRLHGECAAAAAAGFYDDGVAEYAGDVLARWEAVLNALERNPLEAADVVDWVAKYRLLDAYRERHGLSWNDPRLRAMDLQYHDIRPDRSLAARLGLERVVTEASVEAAVITPPESTRAYFRGRCISKYGEDVVTVNWDSIVLDAGEPHLRRIPMLDPLRGTREHVGALLDASGTPAELLRRLAR